MARVHSEFCLLQDNIVAYYNKIWFNKAIIYVKNDMIEGMKCETGYAERKGEKG